MSLRGIDLIGAMTLVAEIGDFTRFARPRELMGFLGLIPSEHTSGNHRRQGHITKTGNSHARRILVEARGTIAIQRVSAQRSRRASKGNPRRYARLPGVKQSDIVTFAKQFCHFGRSRRLF